jgi:hypothetical protein
VAWLWWSETETRLHPYWAKIGFGLFAVAILWSPESLFMSSVVWGPYYCLRRLAETPPKLRVRELARSIAVLAFAVLAIAAAFVILYRVWFGVLPMPSAYLAYVLYPPGPVPINPIGAIWFCVIAFVLGAWASRQLYLEEGNSGAFRRLLLLLLLSYGSLSYAMGRSADNNFVNVVPYSSLILASVLVARLGVFPRAVAAGMLVSLVGLTSTFGWGSWSEAIANKRLLEFDPQGLADSFSFEDPATQPELGARCFPDHCDPIALSRAMAVLKRTSSDPVMVLDRSFLNLATGTDAAWNSMNGPANYYFLPDDVRREFLRRGAERFGKSGWLLIEKVMPPRWIEDFQSVYDVSEDLDFGPYRAVHFVPRR